MLVLPAGPGLRHVAFLGLGVLMCERGPRCPGSEPLSLVAGGVEQLSGHIRERETGAEPIWPGGKGLPPSVLSDAPEERGGLFTPGVRGHPAEGQPLTGRLFRSSQSLCPVSPGARTLSELHLPHCGLRRGSQSEALPTSGRLAARRLLSQRGPIHQKDRRQARAPEGQGTPGREQSPKQLMAAEGAHRSVRGLRGRSPRSPGCGTRRQKRGKTVSSGSHQLGSLPPPLRPCLCSKCSPERDCLGCAGVSGPHRTWGGKFPPGTGCFFQKDGEGRLGRWGGIR